MITMEQCKIFSGLLSNEMVVGPVPSPKHRARLTGYLLNLKWGQATVREMIVADIRAALDLGAINRAADLLIVLRLFLSDHPEARKRQDRNIVDWRLAPMQEPNAAPRRLRSATAPTRPNYSRPAGLRHIGRRCINKMLPPSISDGGLISRRQRSPPLPVYSRPALLIFVARTALLSDKRLSIFSGRIARAA